MLIRGEDKGLILSTEISRRRELRALHDSHAGSAIPGSDERWRCILDRSAPHHLNLVALSARIMDSGFARGELRGAPIHEVRGISALADPGDGIGLHG